MEKLAQQIVYELYGQEYADLIQLFSLHQSLSIQDLEKYSTLPYSRLREIVIILYDQSFLSYTDEKFSVKLDAIIQSLNLPLYLDLVSQRFGPQITELMLLFCEYSYLSLNDTIKELQEKQDEQSIKENFSLLVHKNLIKRIDDQGSSQQEFAYSQKTEANGEPNLPSLRNAKNGRQKPSQAKTSKKRKGAPLDGEEVSLETKKKEKLEKDLELTQSIFLEESLQVAFLIQKQHNSSEIVVEGQVQYHINHAKFIALFRAQCVVDIIRHKFNIQAANLVQALLHLNQKTNYAYIDKLSEFMTVDSILEECKHFKITQSDAELIFQKLKKENFIVEQTILNETKYAVNFDKSIKLFQMKQVERIFENRYGPIYARVLRILKLHKSLDEKKISEAALLSLKETRSILMELFTAKYLQQETFKNENNQNVTVYTLDLPSLFKKMLHLHFQTLFNLKIHQNTLLQSKNQQNLLKMKKTEQAIQEVNQELMQLCYF